MPPFDAYLIFQPFSRCATAITFIDGCRLLYLLFTPMLMIMPLFADEMASFISLSFFLSLSRHYFHDR